MKLFSKPKQKTHKRGAPYWEVAPRSCCLINFKRKTLFIGFQNIFERQLFVVVVTESVKTFQFSMGDTTENGFFFKNYLLILINMSLYHYMHISIELKIVIPYILRTKFQYLFQILSHMKSENSFGNYYIRLTWIYVGIRHY